MGKDRDVELEPSCGGGILPLTNQRGLPCEDELLNAASPRSPNLDNADSIEIVNQKLHTENPVVALQRKMATLGSEYEVDESTVLGIDIGLISCGLAYILDDSIKYLGVRLFESAEDSYTRAPKQKYRRLQRAQRVRLKRRSQRKTAIRNLLIASDMWPDEATRVQFDPHQLRAESLDRLLTPEEFGVAVYHAVRRRGYVPRGDSDFIGNAGFATDDAASGPMTTAAARNEMRSAGYRTAGEMLARDPFFAGRKRNRLGDFKAALSRAMIAQEVAKMFAAQRALGAGFASEELQHTLEYLAFSQLPRRYPAMSRPCPYLPSELLGARRAPTMERYVFLDQLTKIRLVENGELRRLSPTEIARATERFGRTLLVTRPDIRRWLALGSQVRFADARKEEADIISNRGAAYGCFTLRNILGRAVWNEISAEPRNRGLPLPLRMTPCN